MRRTQAAAVAGALAVTLWAGGAKGVGVGEVAGDQVQLDVTDTSLAVQRFDARDKERAEDSGWGDWLNRLDTALRWRHWTAGLRLDSVVYWRRPIDNPNFSGLSASQQTSAAFDNESRFQNSIIPAKMWVTYTMPGVELTLGDAYVQFGRGLTLSMRKIDELGIDTTVRGAKVQIQMDPFALTAVAGFGNPSRVDEASGRAVFPTHDLLPGDRGVAVFGSDRIVGIDIQAGRGLPVTLSTHAVHFSRCAPYEYDGKGNVITDFWTRPGSVTFGSCEAGDTARWLQQLGHVPPTLGDSDITMIGQSIELPSLWKHGQLYIEAAGQQRRGELSASGEGNAIYGTLSLDMRPVATTLEIKSNRNFYAVPSSIDPSRAVEFSPVAYSFLPPAETFDMVDTEGTGNFNACVDGGRLRADVNAAQGLMVFAQGIYANTKSEQSSGGCDKLGHTRASVASGRQEDGIWDGVAGLEWYFDRQVSHVFMSAGARDDTRDDGGVAYREQHVEYSLAKSIGGPWSIEVQGRHRHRREDLQNLDDWWTEGENYVALKMAPKWVFSQGFEYTTFVGQSSYYFNGAILYKFTGSSNLRIFVGQQRGAFRCASGICRYFPPFEGARAELTLRF